MFVDGVSGMEVGVSEAICTLAAKVKANISRGFSLTTTIKQGKQNMSTLIYRAMPWLVPLLAVDVPPFCLAIVFLITTDKCGKSK